MKTRECCKFLSRRSEPARLSRSGTAAFTPLRARFFKPVTKPLEALKRQECREPAKTRPLRGASGEFAGWLLSGAALVLIPKCPACLAGYIALTTGIGISFPVASGLRILLLLLCVGSITFLLVKHLKRLSSSKAD